VLIDVGQPARLGARESLFKMGSATMCIDHHISSKRVFDYNFVNPDAAATAELIYELIGELPIEIDEEMAEALYVAIVTDTGRFQYDCTSGYTHRVTAELLDMGLSPAKASDEIYNNLRIEKLYLENVVMSTMRSVAGGKGVIAYLTRQMLEDTGAMEEETEGIAEKLRSIRGVEVSAFVRETEGGRTKGSMRSKSWYDVATLAVNLGGGGHLRAAGFTTDKPLEEVTSELAEILERTLI
jgi:phosphoesterase RecJ-like protein